MPKVRPNDEDWCFDNWFHKNNKPVAKKKCTCGAHKTSSPNLHSDWCDIMQTNNEPSDEITDKDNNTFYSCS